MIAVPRELLEKIAIYLGTKPFREVAMLMAELQKVAAEAAKQDG